MKKLMALLLTASMIFSILLVGVGCKEEAVTAEEEVAEEEVFEEEATEEEAAEEEAMEEKTAEKPSGKITFWSWHTIDLDIAELFMEEYPDIEVEGVTVGPWDIETKLLTAIASGKGAPDVAAIVSRRFLRFASGPGMADLTEYFSDISSGYIPAALNEGHVYEGKIKGIPSTVAPVAMVYRRDLFDKYGLEVPETMDDLYDIRAKIPDDMYVMPLFVPSGQWGVEIFRHYLQIAGGDIFDENGKVIQDNAIGRQTMNWYKKWVDDGIGMPGAWFSPESYAAIAEGKVVLWICNGGEPNNLMIKFPEMAGQWGSAPAPVWTDGAPNVTANWGSKGWCVPAQSENIPAAVEFIKWFTTSKTALDPLVGNFWLPAYEPYNDSSELLKEPNEYLGGSVPYDVFTGREILPFNFIDWVETSDILGQEIDAMYNGEKTPDQAWNDFEQRLIDSGIGI
jgi:ABC-type glycerol-3-phosphate transport system substrate-binding protein